MHLHAHSSCKTSAQYDLSSWKGAAWPALRARTGGPWVFYVNTESTATEAQWHVEKPHSSRVFRPEGCGLDTLVGRVEKPKETPARVGSDFLMCLL